MGPWSAHLGDRRLVPGLWLPVFRRRKAAVDEEGPGPPTWGTRGLSLARGSPFLDEGRQRWMRRALVPQRGSPRGGPVPRAQGALGRVEDKPLGDQRLVSGSWLPVFRRRKAAVDEEGPGPPEGSPRGGPVPRAQGALGRVEEHRRGPP